MELNVAEQSVESPLPLGQPHFDEEATVLSAKPVVPLQKIKSRARSRKLVIFGLAITCALVGVVLGATFIYKQQGPEPAAESFDAAVSGAAGDAFAEPTPTSTESVDRPTATTSPVVATAPVVKEVPLRVTPTVKPAKAEANQSRPKVDKLDEREQRRAERIAERRARRRAERDAQSEPDGRKRRTSDDLLRIREIFEGPSRP